MRLLIRIVIGIWVMALTIGNVTANENPRANRFQSFVSVLGPVSIAPEETIKVCSTDTSVVTRLRANPAIVDEESDEQESVLSDRRYFDRNDRQRKAARKKHRNRLVWSSTRVEVFDSVDTTRPLPVGIDDIIYASGKGGCAEIPGHAMARSADPRSVIVVLTTLTEARAIFQPIVSGELRSPDGGGTSTALLLPAVQSADGGGGNGGGSCCACAPVCGCGTCD